MPENNISYMIYTVLLHAHAVLSFSCIRLSWNVPHVRNSCDTLLTSGVCSRPLYRTLRYTCSYRHGVCTTQDHSDVDTSLQTLPLLYTWTQPTKYIPSEGPRATATCILRISSELVHQFSACTAWMQLSVGESPSMHLGPRLAAPPMAKKWTGVCINTCRTCIPCSAAQPLHLVQLQKVYKCFTNTSAS